jgi:hypothetical protein
MPRGSSEGSSGGLHYTKSGALDMRYASSRAAIASGSSGYSHSNSVSSSSSSGIGSEYSSSVSSSKSCVGALHYRQDGTPDMRYSSSRQAADCRRSTVSSSYSSCDYSSDLHFKKDGSLDMRYSSSKAAAAASRQCGNELYYKKDGSLDMRYKSSREACGLNMSVSSGREMHYTKDGRLDMRYDSSLVATSLLDGLKKLQLPSARSAQCPRMPGIPDHVPVKSDGTPDMRKTAAKEWVASQGASCDGRNLPSWVPKRKDGSVNLNVALGRAFVDAVSSRTIHLPAEMRRDYWQKRSMDPTFVEQLKSERKTPVQLPPRPATVKGSLPVEYRHSGMTPNVSDAALGDDRSLPKNVLQIDYCRLMFLNGDEKKSVLGKGSFGIVMKAKLGDRYVAVKRLHLDELTKREKDSFTKELLILAHLGTHCSLVELHAYCLNPPCIIMELVELGSLSYLLHYCNDPTVEAQMTDGRIKKKLLYGIACGMYQLHFSRIVHGDLKPQNVLVSDDYVAKITDFGLATLRGKSSSAVASIKLADVDEEPIVVGGTAGYMAPELLDSHRPPEFSSDVYSFGVSVNEVIAEEEPYADQYVNFAGRGRFGAVNYAKQGHRPTVRRGTPSYVKELITRCWSNIPSSRPDFEDIIRIIEQSTFMIPDTV